MPLQFDSSTNEPYLRLPPPHQNIIITPPRQSDGELALQYLNDPKVYKYLNGPPFPYLQEHWEFWFQLIDKQAHEGLEQYLEITSPIGADGTRKWSDVVPVRHIRDTDPSTGEQTFIGDASMARNIFELDHTMDPERREVAKQENLSYEAGDERIEWSFGDYLAPSHHGRGIMTAAVRAIIDEYAVPYMNTHKISAGYFAYNPASRRVLEKCGFVFQYMDEVPIPMPESKRPVLPAKITQGWMMWERKKV